MINRRVVLISLLNIKLGREAHVGDHIAKMKSQFSMQFVVNDPLSEPMPM